ncbi:unnamed protein product [Discula destructiva]
MGFFNFGEAADNYDTVQSGNHEAKLSHELVGGAAAFGAMKAWEKRQRDEGEPVSHARAKEMIAIAVGFEVDRLAETKGRDAFDREQAERHAKQQAEAMYDAQYVDTGKEEWHPDHEAPQEFRDRF